MTLTMTDLFAGGGGTSTGAALASVDVRVAVNHWAPSLATHAANHPTTAHENIDISQADPARFQRTDILWASPSCTHHTRAQGKRRETRQHGEFDIDRAWDWPTIMAAEPDNARATMFDVVRFAEALHHRYVIVENVPEVMDWMFYPQWLQMMGMLGYQHRVQILDAAKVATSGRAVAQHRVRFFATFWRDDQQAPDLITETESLRPADEILDADPGRLISERTRPLAQASMERIEATLDRYPDAQRMIVSYYGASKVGRPSSCPIGTLTTHDRHAVLTRTPRGVAYRMLRNAEAARGMGFRDTYQWCGSTKDVTKQIGNAVATNVARDLCAGIVQVAA